MVVAHLAASGLSRHGDRDLARPLHQPHGVAPVGDDDVGVGDAPLRLLVADERRVRDGGATVEVPVWAKTSWVLAERRPRRSTSRSKGQGPMPTVTNTDRRARAHRRRADGLSRARRRTAPAGGRRACAVLDDDESRSPAHSPGGQTGARDHVERLHPPGRHAGSRAATKYGTATPVPAETTRSIRSRRRCARARAIARADAQRLAGGELLGPRHPLRGEELLRVRAVDSHPAHLVTFPPRAHRHEVQEHATRAADH